LIVRPTINFDFFFCFTKHFNIYPIFATLGSVGSYATLGSGGYYRFSKMYFANLL